ncbi:MAG: substrate-binding domain-containing protein, partial [Desulfobulbaceae bacterium]|nr:substrate-binding domain-containing protein [Desulfobulbaceae bacterium]
YAAKTLIGMRSNTIALVIQNIADQFYAELALAVERKASELGYNTLIYNTGSSSEKEKECIDNLRARGVDGVILSTVTRDDPNVQILIEDRFPFVLINRLSMDPTLANKMDFVVLDNFACGYNGIEHLYRLGHDRIAIIAGALDVSTAFLRTKGSKKALKDFGLGSDSALLMECDYVRENAYRATKKLLAKENAPTAFFAQDDNMAIGVREAILSEQLQIPENIALMGVDNIKMTSLTGVEITTVTQNIYQMGTTGVETLTKKIEGEGSDMVNQVIMEPRIIIRKSCGFQPKGYVR